jgi:hypothetical protein
MHEEGSGLKSKGYDAMTRISGGTLFLALTLLLMNVAASCQQSGATMNSGTTTTSPSWSIELSSEGGIAGRGVGGVAIDASRIEGRDMARSCSVTPTSAELERLQKAIEASDPKSWKPRYADPAAPNGHPDQILYRITWHPDGDAGTSYTTSWYGENSSSTPAAIVRLDRELQEARSRALANCKS